MPLNTIPSDTRLRRESESLNSLRSLNDSAGFTLLELSVVLAIIALVTAMAVTSGIAVVATARQSATVQKMAAIDKAMMAFRVANDRIPCPADIALTSTSSNYGVEAASPGLSGGIWYSCVTGTPTASFYSTNTLETVTNAVEGGVPTVALGLPNDFMYDGWGNHIRYAVDPNMTQAGAFSAMPVGALCSALTVCDSGGVTGNACTNTARSSSAVYILTSHGPNGFGGITQNGTLSPWSPTNSNEQINCHYHITCRTPTSGTATAFYPTVITTPLWVQQSPGYQSGQAGNPFYYFDDIVTYKERWQMALPWDRQGTVCPAVWAIGPTAYTSIEKLDMNSNLLATITPPSGSSADGAVGTFINPLAVDNNGNLWIGDNHNHRVQELSNTGVWMMTIGGGASTPGNSGSNCSGYATSATTAAPLPGTLGYCAQGQSCTCSSGTANGMFSTIDAIAIGPNNTIWTVEESGNWRVQEFTSNGSWVMTFGSIGTGNGQFTPTGIAIDPSNNVWITDSGSNRVEEFNSNGQWIRTIGGDGNSGNLCSQCVSNTACTCTYGTINGQFYQFGGIAADSNGNIWVNDVDNYRLEEFSNTGTFITAVGGGGPPGACTTSPASTSPSCPFGTGTGYFYGAAYIAIDTNNNIWTGGNGNNRLIKFSNIGSVWTTQSTTTGIAIGPIAISR